MSPYQKGYDSAIADVASVAFFIWAISRVYQNKLFRNWPNSLKILALFASAMAVNLMLSYALIPFIHFLNEFFSAGD